MTLLSDTVDPLVVNSLFTGEISFTVLGFFDDRP